MAIKTNELIDKVQDLKTREAPITAIRDALDTAAKQAKLERHSAYLHLIRRANAFSHFIHAGGVEVDNRNHKGNKYE